MKKINIDVIIEKVNKMCIEACCVLDEKVINEYDKAYDNEKTQLSKNILKQLIDNAKLGKKEHIPVCQDTGMVVVFVKIGDKVNIIGGNIEEAINEGVRRGYKQGYLRKSVVRDPFDRINTNDNTPAIIYYEFIKGDKLYIDIMPKGFGSENMSGIKMLKPSDGIEGAKKFIINLVKEAGPNPCPPLFLGIGIGGTMDKAAVLSKKALLREPNSSNYNEYYDKLEKQLKKEINKLNIGPAGLKGETTAFDVFIESYPTHIAGLPVAVTICCHSFRHKGIELW